MKQLLCNKMMQIAILLSLLYVASSCLFVAQPLFAQSGTGSIQGTVTDQSGSVIVGAAVKATNEGTGVVTEIKATGAGFYSLTPLDSGDYTVEFTAAGFAPLRQEHVKVEPIVVTGLNVSLKVGPTTNEIVVTTAPPALDTENASIDTVLPSEAYSSLPVALEGGPKGSSGFAALLPQTNANNTWGMFQMDGGVAGTEGVYLNGMVLVNNTQAGAPDFDSALTTEDVQEFQVITSGVPAQYTGQGIMNVVLKSGTNAFHGDVYENIRNTVFDGPAYNSNTVPVDRQNEYGASAGGRIFKDRMWYFGNLDRYKETGATTPSFSTIPTVPERTGDFSALPVKIYDPTTTTCTGGVCTRQQFSYNGNLNVIPPGYISSISKSLESYLPTPTGSALLNNWLGSPPNGGTRNSWFGRLDTALTSKNHLQLIYSESSSAPIGYPQYCCASGTPGLSLPLPYAQTAPSPGDSLFAQVGETWAARTNLVNSLLLGYQRSKGGKHDLTDSGNYLAATGMTGLPGYAQMQHDFPQIVFLVGPYSPTTWEENAPSDEVSAYNNEVFLDTVQWLKGKQSLSMGFEYDYQQYVDTKASEVGFSFNNAETAGFSSGSIDTGTGNAYASYLLGLVDGAILQDNVVPGTDGRTHQWSLFVQDDWKLTRKLTVNIGLRYTAWYPFIDHKDHQSWFNPDLLNPLVGIPGALQFAGNGPDSCHCHTIAAMHYLAGFDPRVGLAYSINPKTVVRASFTIDHFIGAALGGSNQYNGTLLTGFNAIASPTSPNNGIDPAFNWNSGFPPYVHSPFFDASYGTCQTTLVPASNCQYMFNAVPKTAALPPYAEDWTLSVERTLAPSLVWEVAYTGSESHHIGAFGGVGPYSNVIQPKYLSLGNLLYAQTSDANWSTELAQAHAMFSEIALPYPSYSGPMSQMLKAFPQYPGIDVRLMDPGTASYHSFMTSLNKRYSSGLYLLANYVWSKQMDEGEATIPWENITNGGQHNPWDLKESRSVSSGDVPNAIKIAWVYSLPMGRGHKIGGENGVTNTLLGGWQVAGYAQYFDGNPIGPIIGACNAPTYAGLTYPGCYADYAPGFHGSARINGKYHGDETQTQWLNPAAFANPAPYTLGNTHRTLPYRGYRLPWTNNETAAVGKDFTLTERFKLRLQWDAFNLFNRTIFGGMNTNLSQSNFGYLSGQANTQRQMQAEAYIKW